MEEDPAAQLNLHERAVCAACKTRPAVRLYVGSDGAAERRVPVCADCYEVLIRTPIEAHAS